MGGDGDAAAAFPCHRHGGRADSEQQRGHMTPDAAVGRGRNNNNAGQQHDLGAAT